MVSTHLDNSLVEGQSEPTLPEGVSDADLSLHRAASRCIDPSYDPNAHHY